MEIAILIVLICGIILIVIEQEIIISNQQKIGDQLDNLNDNQQKIFNKLKSIEHILTKSK